MTLTTIEVQLPTGEYDVAAGGEVKEPATAKLLPALTPFRAYWADAMEVTVSSEIAAELESGDLVAVPAAHGPPQPFEITAEPQTLGDQARVACKPARSKRTFAVRQGEEHARAAAIRKEERVAQGERIDRAMKEFERGRELLREAGFPNLAQSITWGSDAAYELGKDIKAMSAAADELEPAAT